jgi:hypothetical protein
VISFILLALSYFLEVTEKIYIEHEEFKDAMSPTELISLVIVNRTLSIITEIPLIILQMRYIVKFLKLKYQEEGYEGFVKSSKKTRFIVIWIFSVLLINSINTLGFNVMQIVIRILQIKSKNA